MNDVIIVGAGIAGLAAAQQLTASGLKVCVLEKSRGVGGRLATRRITTLHGEVLVDHGAQYFTCRSLAFQEVLAPLLAQGTVTTWLDAIPTLTLQGITPASAEHTYPRYCCPQGMTTLAKVLAANLTIQRQSKVDKLSLTADAEWQVSTEAGEFFTAKALILTPPPHQSFTLLGSLREQFAQLVAAWDVQLDPCLAVIAGYGSSTSLNGMPRGLRWQDDPVISWSAVDSSKRAQPPAPVLVFHTTPQFARDHEADHPQSLAALVLEHAAQKLYSQVSLDLRSPEWSQAHYWRYAQPVNPLSDKCLGSALPAPLILGGCWCSQGRVEGAFLSGQAAAQGLLKSGWLD